MFKILDLISSGIEMVRTRKAKWIQLPQPGKHFCNRHDIEIQFINIAKKGPDSLLAFSASACRDFDHRNRRY